MPFALLYPIMSFACGAIVVIFRPTAPQPIAAPQCTSILTCTGGSSVSVVSGLGVNAAVTSTTANTQMCGCYTPPQGDKQCTGHACDYTATCTITVTGANYVQAFPWYPCVPLTSNTFTCNLTPPSAGGYTYNTYYFYTTNVCSGGSLTTVEVEAHRTSSNYQGRYCLT